MGSELSEIESGSSRRDTELTRISVNTATYINPEELEVVNCCGVTRIRPTKETWKVNIEGYCAELKPHYQWVKGVEAAYLEYGQLPRAEFLKEVNALRYDQMDAPNFFDSKVINLQEIMDKSILFSAELLKSVANSKPMHIETKTTSSFTKQRKKSILIPEQRRKTAYRRNSVKVSALDQSLKELFKAKQSQKLTGQAENQLKTFVHFCELLEKHLHNEKHPLTHIKLAFAKDFSEVYGKTETAEDDAMTKDLQQFTQLLKQVVWDFYRVEMLQQLFPICKLISHQNLTNAVSSILFKEEVICKTVEKCYQRVFSKDESALERVLKTKNRINPEDMGVNDEYCLNKRTIDWHMEQLSAESLVENMDVSVVMDFSPYEKCISKLKQLQSTHTPIGKLKVIVSCAEKIQACISEFYHLNALPTKASIVDADQILSIFSFILACSQVKNVYTHLHIIQNFASKQQLKSMTGYYYNVILSAVTHLQKVDDREFSFR